MVILVISHSQVSTLLPSKRPKLNTILAFLSAIELKPDLREFFLSFSCFIFKSFESKDKSTALLVLNTSSTARPLRAVSSEFDKRARGPGFDTRSGQ